MRKSGILTRWGATAILLGLLTACSAEGQGPPLPSTPAPSTVVSPVPSVQTLTPTYGELLVDTSTSETGPTLPWSLIRVDRDLDRIYLSASNSGCVFPTKVRMEETVTSITLTVVGIGGAGPCTLQAVAIFGYVTTRDPIGNRTIDGNTP